MQDTPLLHAVGSVLYLHIPKSSKEYIVEKNYPEYNEFVRGLMGELGEGLPGPMGGFQQLHKAATNDGALSVKFKELIALAIGITVRCDGCIAYHIADALKAGATRDEILETIGVAVLMGGGPSVVYGSEAYRALQQFEEEGLPA